MIKKIKEISSSISSFNNQISQLELFIVFSKDSKVNSSVNSLIKLLKKKVKKKQKKLLKIDKLLVKKSKDDKSFLINFVKERYKQSQLLIPMKVSSKVSGKFEKEGFVLRVNSKVIKVIKMELLLDKKMIKETMQYKASKDGVTVLFFAPKRYSL